MAKGKKSKKTDPRQSARTAATRQRRIDKWKREREKWLNDPAYQHKQAIRKAMLAEKRKVKTEQETHVSQQ